MSNKFIRLGMMNRLVLVNCIEKHMNDNRINPINNNSSSSSSSCFISSKSVRYYNMVCNNIYENRQQQKLLKSTEQFKPYNVNYSQFKKDEKHNKNNSKKNDYGSDSDSDSDDEGKGKRGNSDFWRRKMRTLHAVLDVNNDGVVSYEDYNLFASNFASIGNLNEMEYLEFQNVIKKLWEIQFGEISPYNLINAEQYLQKIHYMINDHNLRDQIHYFLPYLFKAVDKDKSGFISLTEFKIFFKCVGLTEENAAVSFAIIDKDSDGKLSIKEFVKLGRDFFLSENEKRISRMFWGPLVDQ